MENYVGKRLDGRYEIREIVGVGGMAVVYKAYDNIDDRIVAIKILKDEFLANEEFRRRFKNESKAIAVLQHPNIVKVYDVSYGDKLQYIVMEYVEGITLKEYIEQQHVIECKEALHFVTQILRALQHAHDKGIVHRDIKPQNILLLRNGTIKVTDFGIARFSRNETRTMTDSAIGSVHYISPEQARGDITDDKADIYSVGVVLYEMLTGQLPFQSDNTVSVAIMQLQAEAKRPREINPLIPAGIEQITMRAMRKNPRERYQSAAEMLLDLEEFKRNPAITFNYGYFVDKEPTKFIDPADRARISDAIGGQIQSTPPEQSDTEQYEYDGGEGEYEEEEAKSRTVPILAGVATGVVLLTGIIILILVLDPFGIFKDSRIEIPNFLYMNYYTEIQDNEKYKDYTISIKISETSSTNNEAGTVIDQTPTSGSKVAATTEIVLTVIGGYELTPVPDVTGKSYADAETMLKAAGFLVSVQQEYSTTMTKGSVVRTSPALDTLADPGTTVTVFLATDEDSAAVEVPSLVSWNIDIAKEMLAAVGLVCDPTVTIENSAEPEGTVIRQTPEAGEKVISGSSVSVVVSSGFPSVTVTFNLPNLGSNGTLNVFIDNDLISEVSGKQVYLNGNAYSIDVTGSGSGKTLTVLIENTKIYECTVDFASVPPQISDPKTFSYVVPNSKSIVPDVVGMSESAARSKLLSEGFTEVQTVKRIVTSDADVGKVLSQDPEYSIFKYYSTGSLITIYVGAREEPETTAPTTAPTTAAPTTVVGP